MERQNDSNTGGIDDVFFYRPRIVIKFHEYLKIPYNDGAEKYLKEREIVPWDKLVDTFPNITLKRFFTTLESNTIQKLISQAVQHDLDYCPPDLLTYFAIDCPSDLDPEVLAKELSTWHIVQAAYVEGGPTPPPQVNAADDLRSPNQGYLQPAPGGIDAQFAWTFTGGEGTGIQFVDMEQGWVLNHEDLAGANITLISGVNQSFHSHGTSVLGEVVAVDNNVGCVGITPFASARVVSQWRTSSTYNTADAILSAISMLSFGDVILLEAQTTLPGTTFLPVEVEQAVFDVIRLGTALGVVIIEAAGNGSNDLDNFTDSSGRRILDRNSTDYRDSGAIMVGAGSSIAPHSRLNFSNFGSRIDCYAWGENVDTLTGPNGTTTNYTTTFGGTSSASPIITGAAISVQGVAQDRLGYRFSPRQLRSILSDPVNGTVSNNPATDRIGVMPNLRGIITNVLNIVPDVYLRDFVGDTGDPHTGAISASPDIILRKTQVANPQVEFGENSVNRNSNTLGDEAEVGHDNYLYVRVLNRGGTSATNVVATVYWAPVATLVTSDVWTEIGRVTIPNVPVGNILTVSNAIIWSATNIPAPGHYCFIGIIGNEDDPSPDRSNFIDFNKFIRFIRDNNNVTWRNFNVVQKPPSNELIALPFLVTGAPDKMRKMQLEINCKLPEGSKAFWEAPIYLLEVLHVERTPYLRVDHQRNMALLPINPYGIHLLHEGLFPEKLRAECRLLIQLPEKNDKSNYELYIRQLYKEEEVGRVTWRLVPSDKSK